LAGEVVRLPQGEPAQEDLGRALAEALADAPEAPVRTPGAGAWKGADNGPVVHLAGPIGAGKTTLVRGLLRGLGVTAPVKSPTYTLVETYDTGAAQLHHFDLYRLADPEELQFFGAEEYFVPDAICIVEWAERAGEALPPPDVVIEAEYRGPEQREVAFSARTPRGNEILLRMDAAHAAD
jgi:tRNA threonylcarbamoyladenosine biosynthesis protein TsaE